jgi:uncharacterized protein HemX
MGKGSGGGKGLLLLLLLAVLGGAGGYNYHRNMQAEIAEEGPRRLKGYSNQELAALAEAYQAEIEQFRQSVDAARRRKADTQDRGGLQQRVQDFEKVQANSGRQRALNGELIDRQGRLAEIEKEQGMRAPEADPLALHMKRLLTI